MYACLGVTCHLHFLRNYRSLVRATAVTRRIERTLNESRHTKLTLEKKILPPLLPGFELSTFRSRVRRSTYKLSRLPCTVCLHKFYFTVVDWPNERENQVDFFMNSKLPQSITTHFFPCTLYPTAEESFTWPYRQFLVCIEQEQADTYHYFWTKTLWLLVLLDRQVLFQNRLSLSLVGKDKSIASLHWSEGSRKSKLRPSLVDKYAAAAGVYWSADS